MTINDTIDRELAIQQTLDNRTFIEDKWDEWQETSGDGLPPHGTRAERWAAFGPGVVYRRMWALELPAREFVDFVNNHPNKQMTATFDGQQDI